MTSSPSDGATQIAKPDTGADPGDTEALPEITPFLTQQGASSLHQIGSASKARPSDVRRNNKSLVLGLLYPLNQLSRAEIGRRTGLSRVAISDVVAEMMADGLIRESGRTRSSGKGKHGALLGVDCDSLRFLSMDLSEPHLVQGAITDMLGHTIHRSEIALDASDRLSVDQVLDMIEQLLGYGDHPAGIGVAVPGVVSPEDTVTMSTNLAWSDMDLHSLITNRFGLPTVVDNDASSAMLTERFFGKGKRNLLFVQVTRGVGSAVLIDDVPVVGDGHAAGEIGHISVDLNGPLCTCGKNGCLERLIGASVLRSKMTDSESSQTQILTEAGQYLGQALSMPVGLLDINDVCVYGPPDIINDTFIEAAQHHLDVMTTSVFHPHTTVRRCECGGDIVIRGETISLLRHLLVSP